MGGVFQVAFVDLSSANPTPVQVTSEPAGVLNMFSWFAPEFNAPAFSVLVGNPPTQLAVYVKTGPATFKKFHEFSLPAPGFPYLSSPEAFVVNGTSYIFVVAASSLGIGNFPFQPNGPSQVWIAGINPANPFFRRIDDPTQIAVKAEPEVYFTAGGPTIYFQQRGPGDSGNLVIHAADTGLGTDWNYDNQAYSGPWAAAFRDGKNCSCTPFPIGDSYQEVSIFPSLPNRQQARQVMGPEGNLYAPVVHDQSGRAGSVVAFSANSTQTFQVNESDAGSGLQIGNGLVASNGDFLVGGNSNLIRYTSSGMKLWTSPIRGTPTGLKFTPEGNVLALTLNGWFQVFDPGSGRLIREVNVTPPNRKGSTTACLAQGEQGNVKGERKGEEAATQQSDLNGSLRRFNNSYNAGNYAAALVEAQKLEAEAKARLGVAHPDYGSALYNLGLVYAAQGKYAKAEEAYKRALEIMEIKEKVFGAEHPKVAWTLNNLAIVYAAQGKHAEAEVLYKRALEIRQKELGANHPDVAMILKEEESKISSCPFTSPAVDSLNSRVFASYTDGTDNGMIRAFSYSAQTHDIAQLWKSQLFAGNISAPVLSSDYTRVYVQSQHGRLYALDTATGALIWSFDLGISVAGTPVVNEFGYILPGGTKTDSPTVNSLGILKDNGTSATWAFQTTQFSAELLGASGRGNRFALMARRASDNALVLLVVDPNFGVISHTKVTIQPLPVRMTGVVLKENGWIYVGTSGTAPYRVFSPTYATTLN